MRNLHLMPLNPGDPPPGCEFRHVVGYGQGLFAKPYVAVKPSRPKKKKRAKRVTISDLINQINQLKEELKR